MFGLAALPAAILAFAAIGLFAFLGSRYLGDIIGDGWNGIFDLVADMFNAASNWMQRRDPLTLDLDGDGIESVGLRASNPILFDHDGDGVRNGTGWVSSDDGFLVLDRKAQRGEEYDDDAPPPANSPFKAIVKLNRQSLRTAGVEWPISPGMQVVAELKEGERTIHGISAVAGAEGGWGGRS